ncbi:MAG: hypothetical protein GY847_02985 [Proteobacteria bacterium]|nr:hypothetical protein [Pseudomonadota bacterium]
MMQFDRLSNYSLMYIVEIDADIEDNKPLLSNSTPMVALYFIEEQYNHVQGTIKRVSDGSIIASFSTNGGGEFSNHKSVSRWMPDWLAGRLKRDKFSHPFPQY